ncbi:MAG: hypothetical protein MSA26_07430 [Lachnospiraceae bacterium]|nr:hypothetical protein [Lachnospiraceae bacterium]
MPEITVQCEDRQVIVHAALICKSENSSKQPKVYQKICKYNAYPSVFFGKKTVKRQKIHWHAAELERKIPPVIRESVADKQKKLLDNLRKREQYGQGNKNVFLSIF